VIERARFFHRVVGDTPAAVASVPVRAKCRARLLLANRLCERQWETVSSPGSRRPTGRAVSGSTVAATECSGSP
jgi:hypothetical protein